MVAVEVSEVAIAQYTGQQIQVGQWVTADTMMTVGFAGGPAKVVEAKAKSLVVAPAHKNARTGEVSFESPKKRLLSGLTFVCDFEAEAFAIRDANRAFVDQEMAIARRLAEDARARKADAVEALLAKTTLTS